MDNNFGMELNKVVTLSDDIFPSYLWHVLFNNFEDGYYARGLADNELKQKIQSIRRKYNNYFKYRDAMETYKEVMNIIKDKYGDKKLVTYAIENGLIDIQLPPKPRLRMSRTNKKILKSGDSPSLQYAPEPGSYIASDNYVYSDWELAEIDEDNSYDPIPKKIKKILNKTNEKMQEAERKRNIFITSGNGMSSKGVDVIIDFMTQLKSKGYYTNGDIEYRDSLTGIYEENERLSGMSPEEIEDEALQYTTQIVGKFQSLSYDKVKRLEVLSQLAELGIDIDHNAKNNMSKTEFKLLTRTDGYKALNKPLSKKQLKKIKKKSKRDRDLLAKRAKSDAQLTELFVNNKYNIVRENKTTMSDMLKRWT